MTIKIIPAPRSLKPKIEKLCQQTFAEHQARQPYAFPENSYDLLSQTAIDAAFRSSEGLPIKTSPVIFAAMQDEVMVGYIHLSRHAFMPQVNFPRVNIDDIHVVADHRGTGIGEHLLDHVKSLADQHNWDGVTATIWAGNTASQCLFEKCGFQPNSVSLRYGPDRQASNYPESLKASSGTYFFALTLSLAVNMGVLTFILINWMTTAL